MTAIVLQTGFNAAGRPATSRADVAQAIDAAVAAVAFNTATLTALLIKLPTSLPATGGVLWLNGGVLCIS